MRQFLISITVFALLATTIGATAALAISESRAENAVAKRVKARYFTKSGVSTDCRKLTRKRFGCTYQFVALRSGSLCQGGATVRKLRFGIAVRVGKPRAVIEVGDGC